LISIFGKTKSIAEIGAISRLSILLSLISYIIGVLVIPRFAKLVSNKKLLLKYFIQIMLITVLLLTIINMGVYLFATNILWILGKEYNYLTYELLLSMIGSCFALLYGIAFLIYSSRGWAINPFYSISLSLLSVIFGCYIFDISNLRGVLLLNIFTNIVQFFLHFGYAIYKINKVEEN
jgi:hypothetical protein